MDESIEEACSVAFSSPLGQMIAVGTDRALHFLGFEDGLVSSCSFKKGCSVTTDQIQEELKRYFEGRLERFQTPLRFVGTSFQKLVWRYLFCIPIGETISYQALASLIENPLAHRAVANACGRNPFVIVVPCHRVVSKNGIGGYSAGLYRKKWLLAHDKR